MIRTMWAQLKAAGNYRLRVSNVPVASVSKGSGRVLFIPLIAVILVGCINNPKYAALSKSPNSAERPAVQVKPGKVTTKNNSQSTTVATTNGKNSEWYRVAKGDTLYSIAMRFDLDYRRLAEVNAIGSDYHLAIGQRIKLSDIVVQTTAVVPTTKQVAPASSNAVTPSKNAGPGTNKTNQSVSVSAPIGLPIVWQWPLNRNIVKTDASITTQLKGVDISGSMGESIVAAASGVVVFAGSGLRGYGNMVIVQHSGNYLSAYAYASELLVEEKQTVAAGDPLAKMGRVNVAADPALHFEIRKDGKPLNPLTFLP